MPWMTDLAKELVIAFLTAAFTWVWHLVARLAKDLNAGFEKQRCLERRVEDLEYELWGDK